MRKINKKGAIELSIGTIVIIVISLTMLILGIVLVRSIMCGAIGLTVNLNDRVKGEVNKLFEATGGEIQCIGNGGEAVVLSPGKVNVIYCGIRASDETSYVITTEIGDSMTGELKTQIKNWMGGLEETWDGTVAPGDELPKKVARLDIPDDAPEVGIVLTVTAKNKETGRIVSTQDLDFRISRQGLIKAAMC